MLLQEYLNNPMGKGSSFGLSEIRNSLDNQFNEMKYNISADIFKIKDKTILYLIQIPSRHAKNLYYQVVFQFDLGLVPNGVNDIKQLSFTCFSNCPSFSYTYANVFNEKGMLCTWLKDKYDKNIFKKEPDTRNAQKFISYERSLYLAAKYITSSGKNKLDFAKIVGIEIKSASVLSSKIPTQKTIEERYAAATHTKANKDENKDESKSSSVKMGLSHKNSKGYTPSVSSTNKISSSHLTKKVKKI